MNRFRRLHGENSYAGELGVDVLDVLPMGGRWLDIGCGTGVAVREAARLRPDVQIVALDLFAGFHDGRRPPDNLRFLQADAARLPLRTKFDLITAVHVLHFLDDKQACLAGWFDLLAEGGRLYANLDPGDVYLGDRWENAAALDTQPLVMNAPVQWGTFVAARDNGVNRMGVASRASLYR